MTAPAEIKALLELLAPVCKHHGIARLSVDGDKLEMEFAAFSPVTPASVKDFRQTFEQGVPTEEDVLFHSSPGFVPVDRDEHVPAPLARNRKGRG